MEQEKRRKSMSDTKPFIQLRSEEVQDILSAVPNWMIRWGSLLFLAILLGILLLSWLIKYPDTVAGEAVITTEKEPVYLYSRSSGNLTNLYVEEGDLVEKGSLIAEINNPVQKAQIDYLQRILQEVDLFLTENSKVIVFEFEEPNFGEVQVNYNRLKEHIYDFRQLQSPYYRATIERLQGNIDKHKQLTEIFNHKMAIAQRELVNAELKFKADQQLHNEKLIASLELMDKESSLNQRRMELQNLKQALVQNQLALSELQKHLQEQLFGQEESARKLKEDILAEKKIIENFILNWKQGNAITSPSKGKVFFIEKFSEGYYIKSDKPVIAIIPQNSEIIAKVKVSSARYGKVQEGQTVRFELDNFPFQEYGYLYGIIKKKSFIPVEKSYELIIELPKELVSSHGQQLAYRPNMIARAEIIVEDQRLLEKLFFSFRRLIKQ
jgi:multidrug efflux pump subunit AcrA (membrane-fusion protein)